jgi:hypothetical protein
VSVAFAERVPVAGGVGLSRPPLGTDRRLGAIQSAIIDDNACQSRLIWRRLSGLPRYSGVRQLPACRRRWPMMSRVSAKLPAVVNFLLTVTFACGVVIAVAHVVNRRFVAPVYDVLANLTAFGCAVGASVLLGHPVPAILSGLAIACWLVLARRTVLDRRERRGEEPR